LEHYWLPGDAIDDDLEERKRLFLVGITRATESLLITYPRSRTPGDSLNLRKPGCLQRSEFANHLGVTIERS
jgi:superfamily I DNA/RNA helicase